MIRAKSTVANTDECQQKVRSAVRVSPQREAAEEFTRGLIEGVRVTPVGWREHLHSGV